MPAVVRFFRGSLLLGSAEVDGSSSLAELAEACGVEIPINCTSGTCGTCMVRLLSGEIQVTQPLPPGLDEYLLEECARLACIGIPDAEVSVDLTPPL